MTAGRRPRVSVCVPAYNRRHALRATLWSLLRQTFADFNVIVSDNDSSEDLRAEVDAAGDPRIRYIRQTTNLGAAGNFQFLQTVADGDYVLFLCSDDLLAPDCLERTVAALDRNPGRDAVIYRAAHFGESGFSHLSRMPARADATAVDFDADQAVRDFKFTSPSLCLYRLEEFRARGGWDPRLSAVFDWEMYARTVRRGRGVIFLQDVLAIIRADGDRVSNTSAVNWDFFHDVMLLSAPHEYAWGGAYRAMAFAEQLLTDARKRQSPRRTLRHVREARAVRDVLRHLPYELFRRAAVRLRRPPAPDVQPDGDTAPAVVEALDRLWRQSEAVRAGR